MAIEAWGKHRHVDLTPALANGSSFLWHVAVFLLFECTIQFLCSCQVDGFVELSLSRRVVPHSFGTAWVNLVVICSRARTLLALVKVKQVGVELAILVKFLCVGAYFCSLGSLVLPFWVLLEV